MFHVHILLGISIVVNISMTLSSIVSPFSHKLTLPTCWVFWHFVICCIFMFVYLYICVFVFVCSAHQNLIVPLSQSFFFFCSSVTIRVQHKYMHQGQWSKILDIYIIHTWVFLALRHMLYLYICVFVYM